MQVHGPTIIYLYLCSFIKLLESQTPDPYCSYGVIAHFYKGYAQCFRSDCPVFGGKGCQKDCCNNYINDYASWCDVNGPPTTSCKIRSTPDSQCTNGTLVSATYCFRSDCPVFGGPSCLNDSLYYDCCMSVISNNGIYCDFTGPPSISCKLRSEPTSYPTAYPTTNNPTNKPTRFPIADTEKMYDTKIAITYIISKLNDIEIDLFEANSLKMISDSIEMIEANYIVENEVAYEDFMIEIQNVNGFNMDNIYSRHGENITMISNILCKSDIANNLVYKSQNPIFERNVTDDFRNYFANIFPNKRTLLRNDDELQFIVSNADKLQIEFNTPCGSDISIISFAIFGIVEIAVVIVIFWFVIGYLIRFGLFDTNSMEVFSVIGCLLLAFMHGYVRSFIITNVFVSHVETILRFRCNELFWFQIYMLQLGELLLYIYLLSKMKSLNVLKIPMYCFLLLLISCTLLFSATMISWFTIPIIKSGDCNNINSELIICIDSKPSDVGIYKEYVAFLSANICAQCVLCFVFLYKFYQLCAQFGWDGTNKFTYRILSLGIFLVFLNLNEFIYFCITEETFHTIRFTIYSIIIMFSFKICAINEETGNSRWCCWCWMHDDNSIGTKGSLPQNTDEINVLKEAESIGLI